MNFLLENGTETQMAEDMLWEMDPDDDSCLMSREYILQIDTSALFKEKLFERMCCCGFSGDISDTIAAVSFLDGRCRAANIDLERNTLSNWINTGKIAATVDGRKNIYKLCFALDMSMDETAAFFYKAVLEHPFNYKDLYEAVCCFCLNTGRHYAEVDLLVEKAGKMAKNATADPYVTEWVGGGIKACSTEDQFIDFWIQHSATFGDQKQTAKKLTEDLLDKCYKIAPLYCKKVQYPLCLRKIKSPDALLNIIYGYGARKVEDGRRVQTRSIAKSAFPPAIKRNFPQRQQFAEIKKGTASYEVLRKALIVLEFFYFFAGQKVNQVKESPFDDFCKELNDLLYECGYIKMYWRNPFDWMFGYCATMEEPLDALRDLIEVFYLAEAEL